MIDRTSNTHLYQQVFDSIERDIQSGNYAKGEKLPSERELSAQFGVDRITIRKAMDLLSERALIDRIAGSGTYIRGVAGNAAIGDSGMDFNDWRYIVFIMPNDSSFESRINGPFHSEILRVIEKECNKNKYHLVFKTLNADTTLQQLAETKGIAGLIFSSFVDEHHLQAAKRIGIPSVIVNYTSREITSVSIDNTYGVYEAMKYLLKLGHTRIAVISGFSGYQSCRERLQGYRDAIEEYGLDFSQQIVLDGNWQYDGGYNRALDLIRTHSGDMPTALFAMNDAMAFGAIDALMEKGYSIPNDISVVGFDGIASNYFHALRLTTVKVNIPAIGKVAMQHLMNSIDSENQLVRIIVPAELVIGETTAAPRIAN